MASIMGWWAVGQLLKRDTTDADPDGQFPMATSQLTFLSRV
jgi:hypothetical protein